MCCNLDSKPPVFDTHQLMSLDPVELAAVARTMDEAECRRLLVDLVYIEQERRSRRWLEYVKRRQSGGE